MQTCCSQLGGNGTVFIQDGCFAWCDVESPDAGRFVECLSTGTNSTRVYDLACSGKGSDDDEKKSAGTLPYDNPRATLSALFCGVLALSMLYV
jgi:hypothetical protein